MRPICAAVHHGRHGRISGVGVAIVVRPRCLGRKGSRGKANGVARLASHGFIGELPSTPDERGLNGLMVGKTVGSLVRLEGGE